MVLGLALLLAAPALGAEAEARVQPTHSATVADSLVLAPMELVLARVEADSLLLARVEAAFRAGDAGRLLAEAGEPVDLALFGQGGSYTRSQAALVLMNFFRKHPPQEVAFEEEVIAEDRRSIIGYYREVGGTTPAAVFVRLRARDGRWEVRSIRIERVGRR